MNLSLLSPSRTVRQWIAREWLYLLAGFVWAYFLSPILTGLVTLLVSLIRGSGHFFVGPTPLIAFGLRDLSTCADNEMGYSHIAGGQNNGGNKKRRTFRLSDGR